MLGAGKIGMSFVGKPPGIITGPGAPTVLVEGLPISCGGDAFAPHGENQHAKGIVVVSSCSKTVLAMGRPVTVMTRSKGTCGEPVLLGAVTVQVGL